MEPVMPETAPTMRRLARPAPPTDDDRLRQLMADMAADQRSPSTFAFATEFRAPLEAAMRSHLAHHGMRRPRADDVEGLVLDAAMSIARCAVSWQPDGAPPWVWAARRLGELARQHVGQWSDPFDADRVDAFLEATRGFDGHDAFLRDVLDEALADGALGPHLVRDADLDPGPDLDPGADVSGPPTTELGVLALVREALERVATPRDQAIVLELCGQHAAGDPSPSHTVADAFGLRPDAVRQVGHRVRRRLGALVATEPRFAALAGLPLLTARASTPASRSRPRRPAGTRACVAAGADRRVAEHPDGGPRALPQAGEAA